MSANYSDYSENQGIILRDGLKRHQGLREDDTEAVLRQSAIFIRKLYKKSSPRTKRHSQMARNRLVRICYIPVTPPSPAPFWVA
jgi:hypothetical protein